MTWKKEFDNSTAGNIDPKNIDYVQVEHEATGNLFDSRDVIPNGYYNSANWYKDINYVSSQFIPVEPSQPYMIIGSSTQLIDYWDANKVFIKMERLNSFTTPANAAFITFPIKNSEVSGVMLVKGNTPPPAYVPYAPTPLFKFSKDSFDIGLQPKSVDLDNLSDSLVSYIKTPTDQERLDRGTPTQDLYIETSQFGDNQPIHPSVIAFDSPWKGWKYWMAYTPFPYALDPPENPEIAVSNDLIYWTTPDGYTNPLDSAQLQDYWTYCSDTCILYRADLDQIEVWYNINLASGTYTGNPDDDPRQGYFRKTSTDGVNWSARQKMSPTHWSPSVIWDSNRSIYRMWTFFEPGYYESTDSSGTTWNTIYSGSIPTDTNGVTIPSWHGCVIPTTKGYEMILQPDTNHDEYIIHYYSDDGITWKVPGVPILRRRQPFNIGGDGWYRPWLLQTSDGHYYTFVTSIDTNGRRGVCLSYTTEPNDITTLKGITPADTKQMNRPKRLTRTALYQNEIRFDEFLNKAVIATQKGGAFSDAVWKDFQGNIVPPINKTPPVITPSLDGGAYVGTQTITLTSNQSDTIIYYTVDGSEPDFRGEIYQGAITIASTTTLQYFGVNSDGYMSYLQTKTYTIS